MIGRLQGWLDGDVAARDPSVETADEVIRQIVQRRVHTAPDGTAFDAAGLLAEALEQLIELRLVQWTQRARFFTVAVRLVRTLVVQRHRAAVALPRGERVTLAERDAGTPPLAVDLDRLDAALDRLADQDRPLAQLVELQYFGGLSIDDAADALDLGADGPRAWTLARAWLMSEARASFPPAPWRRIKAAFDEAAPLPADQRAAIDDDPAVQHEVAALLAIHDQAGAFLEHHPPGLLAAGTRLGPYEIVARLGSGGMGDVYRAHDTRLVRDVAIKVVRGPIAAAARARFQREARAIAALSHPGVLAIFDVGEDRGTPYLVTEILVGETLRARLRRGRPTIAVAVDWAIQIAEGLAAAHAQGIVHRDLKPENVFVIDGVRVKILDFGIASAPVPPRRPGEATTPRDEALSVPGMIVGTPGYLAPEQARGIPVTTAADLFALGAMLFELLTGTGAFPGGTGVATVRSVLEHEPPAPSTLAPDVPPWLDRIVARCLAKELDQRFESARDLAFALTAPPAAGPAQVAAPRARWPVALIGLGVGLVAGAGVAAALWSRRSAPTGSTSAAPPPVLTPARSFPITHTGRDRHPSVSPDGRFLAFTSDRDGRSRIWVQQLDVGSETPLTEGVDRAPRFSPDGNQVLFTRVRPDGTALFRVGLLGGEVHQVAADASDGDWSPDGRQVVFVRARVDGERVWTALMIADAAGGGERELAALGDRPQRGRGVEQRVRWSPDGAQIAVSGFVHHPGAPQQIQLFPVDGGPPTAVDAPNRIGLVSAIAWDGPDAVIYSQSLTVSGNSAGSPAQLVRQRLADGATATLLWTPESSVVVDRWADRGVVFDARSSRTNLREVTLADGASRRLSQGTSTDRQPSLASDGERLVFTSNRGGNLDIWLMDRRSGTPRRLTDHPGTDFDPTLTRSGQLVWSSDRSGAFEIWMADADGANPRQLSRDGVDAENPSLTADGAWLIYASGAPGRAGIWKLPTGGGPATLLVADAILPMVSPDGRHVLFQTNRDPSQTIIGVVTLADAQLLPFEIKIDVRRPGPLLGRARWTPDGAAIAFIGQDDDGATGVFLQPFAPDGDARAPRRPLAGFEADWSTESFDLDGARVILAESDLRSDVMAATGLPSGP